MFKFDFSEPIITSLLDVDFYKFTMGQIVYLLHPNTQVRYSMTNRTKSMPLAEIIPMPALIEQLDHAMTLRCQNSELHYLRGTDEYGERMFREPYLQFMAKLQLPQYTLRKSRDGSQYILEVEGNWAEAIYWETIMLSIVSEMLYRTLLQRDFSRFEIENKIATGISRLFEKTRELKQNPDTIFTDFSTRRRFARFWQDYVVATLAAELPRTQFLGTSNTYLAMKHSLVPMGTAAHELDMVYYGIYHDKPRESHRIMLEDWWQLYGAGLSIALTDTYGSDFFFQDMTQAQAENWKGLRQDSGDPAEFARKAIAFYQAHGIDPKDKMIIFSDGLDLPKMQELARSFGDQIRVSFGWGTNLGNDLGLANLSLVVKAVEADGHGLVKLSDNPAKAIGQPEDIARCRQIFGYDASTKQTDEPRY